MRALRSIPVQFGHFNAYNSSRGQSNDKCGRCLFVIRACAANPANCLWRRVFEGALSPNERPEMDIVFGYGSVRLRTK